jgi:hypothetical protein
LPKTNIHAGSEIPGPINAPNRKRLAVLAVERVCLYLVANQSNGQSTFYSVPLALNWNPLTSADSTDQNPVVPQ